MSDPARPTEPFTSRRTVLRTAGLVALAGGGVATLGACAADAETTAPTASSSAPAAPSPAASSASPSAQASSATPSASAKVPSGPSVATADVEVGGGVILDDADFVITQPKKGEFKAFSKVCTHQGCPVTEVTGGTINCNCHGSKFSIEDGSVTNAPANKPLAEAKVTVAGGKVYVNG